VLRHFLPVRSLRRILLHRFAQELEAGETDLDVLWPSPCSLLDLAVEKLEGHLVSCLFFYVEDEHTRQHLIEDYTDGPYINLMAVALSATPVCLNLLSRHHKRRALERKRAVVALLS